MYASDCLYLDIAKTNCLSNKFNEKSGWTKLVIKNAWSILLTAGLIKEFFLFSIPFIYPLSFSSSDNFVGIVASVASVITYITPSSFACLISSNLAGSSASVLL